MRVKQIQRNFFAIMYRLFLPAREMPRLFVRAIIPTSLNAGAAVYTISLVQNIVDSLETGAAVPIDDFIILVCVALGLLVLNGVMKNWGYSQIRPMVGKFLHAKSLEEYVYLDNNQVEGLGTGRVIAIVDKGIRAWCDLSGLLTIKLGGQIVTLLFALTYVFSIGPVYGRLFLLFISMSTATYVFTLLSANRIRRKRKKLQIGLMRDFVKIVMSKLEILQSDKVGSSIQAVKKQFDDRLPLNYQIETRRFIGDAITQGSINFLRILVLGIMIWGWFSWSLTVGELLALITIFAMLEGITEKISRVLIDGTKAFISVEKMRDMYDSIPTIKGYETGRQFTYSQGDIVCEKMVVGYKEGDPIFSDFSLTIAGGKKTALVGSSGSGKTTLVKIVAGYLRPRSGKVFVDGQDLEEVSLKSYYQHIGYLTQEPSVFDGTIRENLAFGLTDDQYTDQELQQQVRHALSKSKCDFVYDMPLGVQTEIGERGVRLSGGQRQRLAIAKILLKNPQIIILDEPTSALDSFSEEAITEAMHNLFENRTVLIVAHRLQTVKQADDIILLEQGKVEERGTHKQLVERGGKYAQMLELQSGF